MSNHKDDDLHPFWEEEDDCGIAPENYRIQDIENCPNGGPREKTCKNCSIHCDVRFEKEQEMLCDGNCEECDRYDICFDLDGAYSEMPSIFDIEYQDPYDDDHILPLELADICDNNCKECDEHFCLKHAESQNARKQINALHPGRIISIVPSHKRNLKNCKCGSMAIPFALRFIPEERDQVTQVGFLYCLPCKKVLIF